MVTKNLSGVRFSVALTYAIAGIDVLLALTYIGVGANNTVDFSSVVLAWELSVVLIAILWAAADEIKPLALLSAAILAVYYLLRVWSLLVFPDSLRNLQRVHVSPDQEALLRTLAYVVFGTLAFASGLVLGGWVPVRRQKLRVDREVAPVQGSAIVATVMLVAMIGVLIFAFFQLGFGRFSGFVPRMSPIRAVLFLLDPDVVFVIWLVLIGEQWPSLGRRRFLIAASAVVVYMAGRTVTGSKAGVYQVLLYWMIWRLAVEGDFRFSVGRMLRYVVPMAAVLFLTFYLGTFTRNWIVYDQGRPLGLSDIILALEPPPQGTPSTQRNESVGAMMARMSSRVSGIDPLMVVLNDTEANPRGYITWKTVIQSTVHKMIPGPWTDFGVTPVANVFQTVYNGLSNPKSSNTTVMWTMFGMYYVHWGWWAGLVVLGLTGCFLALVYRLILRITSPYRTFLRIWWLLALYWLWINPGFDTIASYLWSMLILGGIYLYLIRLGTRLAKSWAKVPAPLATGGSAAP